MPHGRAQAAVSGHWVLASDMVNGSFQRAHFKPLKLLTGQGEHMGIWTQLILAYLALCILFTAGWIVIGRRLKAAKFPAVRYDIDHDPRETVETRYRSAAQ